MRKIIEVSFCILFFIGMLYSVRGFICSSTRTATQFSQCIVTELNRSPFFSRKERERMTVVASVMLNTLRRLGSRANTASIRIVTIGFASSFADIIITNDYVSNIPRKSAYSSALEKCSVVSTGFIDSDLITEAIRIMSTLEYEKLPVVETEDFEYDDDDDHQKTFDDDDKASEVPYDYYYSSTPQQISHVTNPTQNTKFGHLVHDSYNPSPRSSKVNIHYPLSPESEESWTPLEEKRKMESFASGSDSISQIRVPASSVKASPPAPLQQSVNLPLSVINAPTTDFQNRDIKVPQTKQSFAVVIQPSVPSDTDTNTSAHKDVDSKILNYNFQEQNTTNAPQEPDISSNQTSSQAQNLDDFNIDFSSSLEGIIFSLLVNSPSFNKAFAFGVDNQKAINLARSITEESLKGFNKNIINESIEAVSKSVLSVTVRTPENYALAISNGLGSVLRLQNKSLFAGTEFASGMLSSMNNNTQILLKTDDSRDQRELEINKTNEWEEHVPIDFQMDVLEPEDIEGELFSNSLKRLLSDSGNIHNLFCNNVSSNTLQICFNMVKSSLAHYGSQISSISASSTFSSLSVLTQEQLCTKYARVISDTISEVLDENGLLYDANADDILNKMENSLKEKAAEKSAPERRKTIWTVTDNVTENNDDSYQNMSQNNTPSYDDYDELQDSDLSQYGHLPYTEYAIPESKETVTKYHEHSTKQKQHEESKALSNENGATSSISTQMPYTNYPGSDYDDSDYFGQTTISPSTSITDEEFESTTPLIIDVLDTSHKVITQSNTKLNSPTEKRKELAHLLLHEMLSVLKALGKGSPEQQIQSRQKSKDSPEDVFEYVDQEKINVSSVETSAQDKISDDTQNSRVKKINNKQRRDRTTIQPEEVTHASRVRIDDIQISPTKVTLIENQESFKYKADSGRHLSKSNLSDIKPSPVNVNDHRERSRDSTINDTIEGKNSPSTTLHASNRQHETSDIASSGKSVSSTKLQASFVEPQAPSSTSLTSQLPQHKDGSENKEEELLIAEAVSDISTSSIKILRSDNFNMYQLCSKFDELAEVVRLPSIDYCNPYALIDFLLHVLQSLTNIMKNV